MKHFMTIILEENLSMGNLLVVLQIKAEIFLFQRKKKKKSELDIISSNIQKSSQNLNQPDIFYAGLFNQLIGNYKNKSTCRILNISQHFEGTNDKNNIKSFRLHTSDNISN